MNVIFLVEAGVDYEGATPVRAFADRTEAEAFAEQCREYHKTRPDWPASDATPDDIEAWRDAHKAWDEGHPGGNVGSPDYFGVIEVPYGPGRRTTPQTDKEVEDHQW